jgi:hypothetical protein
VLKGGGGHRAETGGEENGTERGGGVLGQEEEGSYSRKGNRTGKLHTTMGLRSLEPSWSEWRRGERDQGDVTYTEMEKKDLSKDVRMKTGVKEG